MPRYPDSSSSARSIRGGVFSSLAHKLATYSGEVYPLHVGDTWMEPPEGCRMEDLRVDDFPGMHRYASTQGMRELMERIVERTRQRTGVQVGPENVLVTGGATGGLAMVVGGIAEPGDEILILAPHWPLIAGMVRSFHARPVVVPFFDVADSAASAVEVVKARYTDKTVALYLNTPNNPTGRVIPRPWVEALVQWAQGENLWILADEVYEDYAYQSEHTYSLPLAPDQTFAVHSFSKAYGMAGNRCGYVLGPAETIEELHKVHTHVFYSTPTASQIAACRILDGLGEPWIEDARRKYWDLGQETARRLGVPPPEGSSFLFLDVQEWLGEGGLGPFLESCADQGVFLSPGPSFGPYPTHVRICFTAAPPDVTRRGVEVLATILGR